MMSRHTSCLLGVVLLGALAAGGCQKSMKQEATYPTRGRILHKGQPVRYAMIHFIPVDPDKGRDADGFTQGDGTFELRTYSNTDRDGAVPGTYRIELSDYDPVEAGAIPRGAKPTRLPKEAKSPDVTVEVAAEDNDLNIEIP